MSHTKRCSCHPADIYGTLSWCPNCGHWSYDDGIGCERRRCAHAKPEDRDPS